MTIPPPVVPPPLPPARRPPIVHRYGIDFCSACSLMLDYCTCPTRPPEEPSKDARAESDLSKRIRETKR